jgi:hypothetical protein
MTIKKLEEIIAGPIKTDDATLTVQMPGEKLKVGGHTFQLVVTDDSGNVSAPATVMVIVVDTDAPTAVVTVSNEQGRPLEGNRLPFGSGFILDGKRSVDIGGNIVSYNWTLVD